MTTDPRSQPSTPSAWYPKDDVVGIVDDAAAAGRVVAALEAAGVAAAGIRTWTLAEVEAGFQAYREHRATLERFGADLSGPEIQAAETYYAALKQGQPVLSVHAPRPDQVERVARVLTSQHVRALRYYGPWTVAGLPTIIST